MGGLRRVRLGTVLTVVAMALALGGCGRRGKLEPPPDPGNPFALGTPQPAATDKDRSGLHRRPKNPEIQPPDQPFILDPLL